MIARSKSRHPTPKSQRGRRRGHTHSHKEEETSPSGTWSAGSRGQVRRSRAGGRGGRRISATSRLPTRRGATRRSPAARPGRAPRARERRRAVPLPPLLFPADPRMGRGVVRTPRLERRGARGSVSTRLRVVFGPVPATARSERLESLGASAGVAPACCRRGCIFETSDLKIHFSWGTRVLMHIFARTCDARRCHGGDSVLKSPLAPVGRRSSLPRKDVRRRLREFLRRRSALLSPGWNSVSDAVHTRGPQSKWGTVPVPPLHV